MCYFLLGFLDSGYEAVGNCQPFRILERAVLNVAGFAWRARTERQGERDCECGEVYHLSQIVPSSSYHQGLEEEIIVHEPVADAGLGIKEMFGTMTHANWLGDRPATPHLPASNDDQSVHLANDELGHCINYRTKFYTRYNTATIDEIEYDDEVFVIDEEKDNMIMFTPCDVAAEKTIGGERGDEEAAALCSKYSENVYESDLYTDKCDEECELQEQKWNSELEEEIKASWNVDPTNTTTQSSSYREAELDPIYNTNAAVMSLMDDLAAFKSVLVTLATHLDEAGDDSPSLEEQIERVLSEEFHREESPSPAKQPEQQQHYHKTLESISSDMVVIRTSLDSLQDVLNISPSKDRPMEFCGL